MSRRTNRIQMALLVAAVMAATFSCSSALQLQTVTQNHRQADYQGAYDELKSLETHYVERQGRLLFALDAGLLAHYAHQWDSSNRFLDEAERRIWEAYTESITANVASYLVNDNTRAYQGEDYEDIYANVFKALNYVHMGDPDAAMVELRRFSEKQQMLQDKYDTLMAAVDTTAGRSAGYQVDANLSIRFSSSALGNWLHMVLARDSGEVSQAQFSANQVRQAFAKQPTIYPFKVPATVAKDLSVPTDGKVRVNLVAFTGLAPFKEEVVERFWLSPANYVKIALPSMVERPTSVASIDVRLSDGTRFVLEPMEDIAMVAQEAFRLKRSYIESKTVIRSLLKSTGTAVIDATTDVMSSNAETREEANSIQFYGTLLSFASRIFNEASEQADVRLSHFYPDMAWAGGVDLPVGTYDAHVVYRDRSGRIIHEQNLTGLEVAPGNLGLWESVCPL
ncbi:MAG TPA: hypothetical protein DEZ27_05670 [Sphaerochaeta sp.]|nr:hypothetical protein [Sphaerochaeta sp.]